MVQERALLFVQYAWGLGERQDFWVVPSRWEITLNTDVQRQRLNWNCKLQHSICRSNNQLIILFILEKFHVHSLTISIQKSVFLIFSANILLKKLISIMTLIKQIQISQTFSMYMYLTCIFFHLLDCGLVMLTNIQFLQLWIFFT